MLLRPCLPKWSCGRPTVAPRCDGRVSLRFRRACSGAGSRRHRAFARPKRARPGTSRGSRVGEGRSTPPRRRGRSGPVMSRWGAAPARKSNLKSNRPPAREEDKTKEYMNPGRGPNGLLISTLGTQDVAAGLEHGQERPRGGAFRVAYGRIVLLPLGAARVALRESKCADSHRLWPPCRKVCLLYTSPSPRDATLSRMPSSA